MTAKQSAKTTVPAQVTFNGWPRDPKGGMLWLPLPEKVAALIEGTDEFAASYVCKRGTGKGFTVILATRPTETAKLLAVFKALVAKPETKALASAAVKRITVEAPKWNNGIEGLRADGWPKRAKVEKVEPKLTDIAVHKPKAKPAAKTPRRASSNPRTQARKLVAGMAKRQAARKATETEQAMADAIVNRAQA